MPLPIEIIALGRPEVRIVWDEDHEAIFSARELRTRCNCAHCVEEMTGRKLIDQPGQPGSPEHVTVTNIALMGNYGIRITFSDGHGTGIFRFAELYAACPCDACSARR